MNRRGLVERPVSAGGIVTRTGENGVEVLLCGRLSPALWALPKGTPDPGESHEETALREVGEETGLEVKALRFVDSIDYWFARPSDGVRCHKTVHYYLMRPTGGDTGLHDGEFDDVRWFPAGLALEKMTYGNEAEVVEKGLSMASE